MNPATGLHFDDVNKLVTILEIIEGGNTVVMSEHRNLDVIKTADYIIIDMDQMVVIGYGIE